MKIGTIECIPDEDPYRRNTSADYQTYCQVWCVPGKTIGICQESGAAGNGIPEEEYHNRTLTEGLEGYPDEDEAREYLESDEVQDLLDRVDDGFEVVWDGNNHVGEMNADAQTAWDQIIAGLQKLCRELSIAMANDYCYDEIRSIARMTADELNDYDVASESSTMESEAYDNGCILIGCDSALEQAVNERRDQLFEEMESAADEFASEEYPDYPYQSDLYAMIRAAEDAHASSITAAIDEDAQRLLKDYHFWQRARAFGKQYAPNGSFDRFQATRYAQMQEQEMDREVYRDTRNWQQEVSKYLEREANASGLKTYDHYVSFVPLSGDSVRFRGVDIHVDSALFSFNTKLPVRLIPALILDQRFHEEHIGYVVELNGKHSDWIPVVGAHDVVVWAEKRRGADIVIPECLATLKSAQQKLAEAERALSQAKREAERAQWELDENRRIVQESLKHLSVVGQSAASSWPSPKSA